MLATVNAASFAHAPTTNRIRRMRMNIVRNLAFIFSLNNVIGSLPSLLSAGLYIPLTEGRSTKKEGMMMAAGGSGLEPIPKKEKKQRILNDL